jgi:error-prone DNA polymerase
MPPSEHVVNDYQTLKLSLKAHPMSFLRAVCSEHEVIDNRDLKNSRDGTRVSVAGIVLVRQRPGSASGVVFLTLEDEFGICNAVVWPDILETYRATVMGARLMLIRGRLQRAGDIIHVVAQHIEDKTSWLALLSDDLRHVADPLTPADKLVHPGHDKRVAGHPRLVRIIPKSRDFQ